MEQLLVWQPSTLRTTAHGTATALGSRLSLLTPVRMLKVSIYLTGHSRPHALCMCHRTAQGSGA